jgi:hypothetical protein
VDDKSKERGTSNKEPGIRRRPWAKADAVKNKELTTKNKESAAAHGLRRTQQGTTNEQQRTTNK